MFINALSSNRLRLGSRFDGDPGHSLAPVRNKSLDSLLIVTVLVSAMVDGDLMEFQRSTRQRQVILGELQKLTSHPTASDLYSIVRQQLPKISLGTVYRNLELLARSGTIKKIDSSGREARFDPNVSSHHHLRCLECGRVDDAPFQAEVETAPAPSAPAGWELRETRVEHLGVCPACREKSALDGQDVN